MVIVMKVTRRLKIFISGQAKDKALKTRSMVLVKYKSHEKIHVLATKELSFQSRLPRTGKSNNKERHLKKETTEALPT